jgi:sugar phosphate isomerase/epimerase
MRFACVNMVAPGGDLAAQCAAIAKAGCAGVETLLFPTKELEAWQQAIGAATGNAGLQIASVILGGLALYQAGQESWLAEAIHAVGEVGGGVLMTPEYRPQDPLPIFPPYPQASSAEIDAVARAMAVVDDAARRWRTTVFLEPLTQFEARFWRDVGTAQRVCEECANPWIGLALDFHNMNITEANIVATIVRAGKWVRHVHLADNNRRLPGQGHINFRAGVATLDAIGYDGWYSFECATGHEELDGFVNALRQAQSWLVQAF